MTEKSLPKVIDAKTHGIIDYCHAAFFLTLGFLCLKANKRAASAALATGSFVLVQSLLTDYPLGLKPVLSFATHGQMDAGFASASWPFRASSASRIPRRPASSRPTPWSRAPSSASPTPTQSTPAPKRTLDRHCYTRKKIRLRYNIQINPQSSITTHSA